MKILIVEDDTTLANQLKQLLLQENYDVDSCVDGEEGLFRIREYSYDLAVVDLGLPKCSGLDIISVLRNESNTVPILVLTARSHWRDKVTALKSGADDYLVKPFQPEELLARVQAMIRRAGGYASSQIIHGPIRLDINAQNVWYDDVPVALTAFEYKIANYFLLNPNKVISKMQLADHLYDDDADPDSNVIEVIIARLRQKLDPSGCLKPIETLRNRGYRFAIKNSI